VGFDATMRRNLCHCSGYAEVSEEWRSNEQSYKMKVYAKLYINKITDIVTLGMQNESFKNTQICKE
jgi:hypothetical protein